MLRLLHLSDLHFGGREPHAMAAPAQRLRSVLDAAEPSGPFDAVVVTGDVCDNGAEADAVAAREHLVSLAPLVVAVPGNHDDTAVVTDVFGEPAPALDDWSLLGVATNVAGEIHGDGRPLADALRQVAADRPAVVLHHHPVHSHSTHPWFVLEHRDAVLAALAAREAPLLMLSGHTHEGFELHAGPVHFLGAPSTYYGLRHTGDTWEPSPATGANVIDLRRDGTVESQVVYG